MEGTVFACPCPLSTTVLLHSRIRRTRVVSGLPQEKEARRGRRRQWRLSPEKAGVRHRSDTGVVGGTTCEMVNPRPLLSLGGGGCGIRSCGKVCELQYHPFERGAISAVSAPPEFASLGFGKSRYRERRHVNSSAQESREILSRKTCANGGHRGSTRRSRLNLARTAFSFNISSCKALDRSNNNIIVRASRDGAVAGRGDEDDDGDDTFGGRFREQSSSASPRRSSKGLPPPHARLVTGWVLYLAGTLAATAAVIVAQKGSQSTNAHGSVRSGGGNGQSVPPGSGGGRGGGHGGGGGGGGTGEGGGSADFNSRRGNTSFLDPLHGYSTSRRDEEKSSASENVPGRLLGMSIGEPGAAVGDYLDREYAGRADGMKKSRRAIEGMDHIPNYLHSAESSEGMFPAPGTATTSRGDGETEEVLRGAERSLNGYNPEASGNVSEFKSSSSPYSSKANSNLKESQQNFAQGGELGKNYLRADSHLGPVRPGDLREVPLEFSSIRGKITEIPGYGREGSGKVHAYIHQQQPAQKSSFSGWLGGLVHSILGTGSSGRKAGNDDHDQGLDEESKKSLVMEVAARTLQMLAEQPNETGLAKSSETGALRRLQRETFADLLKIRERLSKLEHHSGMTGASYSGSAAAAAAAKTTLKGEVSSGGAFVLVDELTSNLSRSALQHAGLLTGLDVRFTFETRMRENDLLLTQCGIGQVSGESDGSILGGPISLQKISYTAQINDILSVSVSPMGSRACDMADSVNHLQGQALTSFAGSGPALYKHCRGSAVGASLRSDSVLVSMGQYLSGWGSRAADATSSPLCISTLAQIMIQPFEHMVFSLSAVNNLWPSPPLPSSNGFHWSEMGPLVLSKTVTRPTHPTGTFTFTDLPSSSGTSFLSQGHLPERDSWSPDAESRGPAGSSGTAMQSVALAGELDLGGHVSLGGWAQVERADWLEELEKKDFQWNLSLAKSTGSNVNWGLSVGRRKRDEWSGDDGSASLHSGTPLESSLSQLQMEAFVRLTVGRGFSLQPGVVYVLDKDTQTPAFMLRSSWTL